MAWSDAARQAAAEARRLRRNTLGSNKKRVRKLLFKNLRAGNMVHEGNLYLKKPGGGFSLYSGPEAMRQALIKARVTPPRFPSGYRVLPNGSWGLKNK